MSRYDELGVDIRKRGTESFRGIVDNLFPGAFCVVQRDPHNPGWGLVSHTDSAGSKPVQSYLHWRETGDPSWFEGLTQDVVAMNLDDIICVAAEPVSFIDYIAFNTLLIDRVGLLGALAKGFTGCFRTLSEQKIPLLFGGGETADLPDQLRTLDVSGAVFGRVDLGSAVTGENIHPGDLIVGIRSGGRARYEKNINSGIMCNGLTLARSSLMKKEYLEEYPEMAHPARGRYTGRFGFDEYCEDLGLTVGEALLSPTRIFAPIALKVLEKVKDSVHGMVHNTGGGLTKCLHLGKGILWVKDSLPEPDPIFRLIQKDSGAGWREMHQDFNMGVGFEIVVEPGAADDVLAISEGFNVGAQIIGRCERGETENSLLIRTNEGKFRYP